MKIKTTGYHITKIEATDDKINGRGGLAFILRYFENIKVFGLIESVFFGLCANRKGKSAGMIIRQIMAKMIDGTDHSISGFDRLKKDEGYGAIIETNRRDLLSSYMVKRFFRKFIYGKEKLFRKILTELFVWRLKITQPPVIILDMDTMVLDNDGAKKRHGVDVTYKNKKGFQPLQLSWGTKIIDALFRRGSAHSNHGDDAKIMVKKAVKIIRSRYSEQVPIIVTMDSGFFDQKNLEYFEDELKIFYVITGKLYKGVKKHVEGLAEKEFKDFIGKNNRWKYVEFGSKLDSWKKFRRAIYTSLVQEDGQMLLEFARPDTVLYTNIGMSGDKTAQLEATGNEDCLHAEKIIAIAHGRGSSELNHRSFKEFTGREQLPFKLFGMNGAYYYIQLITHFLFECYKEDVAFEAIPVTSYPNTFRRKLIDFAAKIIVTGNRVILQAAKAFWKESKLEEVWRRCNSPTPITFSL